MILSDGTIKQLAEIGLIDPFTTKQLQPASYDLTLDKFLLTFSDTIKKIHLEPKEFILASTLETVRIPGHIVGRIEGKSSWARRGIIIHTAGFVDPGFVGQLTLEITNLSNKYVVLSAGDLIAQIAFEFMDKPCIRRYGNPLLNSHYQGQIGPTLPTENIAKNETYLA